MQEKVPIGPDRKTGFGGDECLDLVVTKGLDLAIGKRKWELMLLKRDRSIQLSHMKC